MKKQKRIKKLDWDKIGFTIIFIVTMILLINKIITSGTIFCLTTIYR